MFFEIKFHYADTLRSERLTCILIKFKGMVANKWTKEEDTFLTKNYPMNGAKWCANELGRTLRATQLRRQKLWLKMLEKSKRKTKIKYTKDILESVVKDCKSYAEVIRAVGLVAQSGNYETVKSRIAEYEIDVSHFLSASEITKNRLSLNRNNFEGKPLSEILVVDSNYNTQSLKERLYNEGLKKRECELCGQGEIWNGRKMSLILDHKNGIHTDCRPENLQIVCPNCNATLDTHCSKNRKIKSKRISNEDVEQIKSLKEDIVASEVETVENHRPPVEQLLRELNVMSYRHVGEKYGVVDNTIRKWIRKAGMVPPVKNNRAKKLGNKNQIKIEL